VQKSDPLSMPLRQWLLCSGTAKLNSRGCMSFPCHRDSNAGHRDRDLSGRALLHQRPAGTSLIKLPCVPRTALAGSFSPLKATQGLARSCTTSRLNHVIEAKSEVLVLRRRGWFNTLNTLITTIESRLPILRWRLSRSPFDYEVLDMHVPSRKSRVAILANHVLCVS
jgi:hypothetical protein